MNEIYVVGHRNPDTDSIVAAMSYAALRNALGDRDYVAAYLGHVSDETQRLLNRFGFQPPQLIQNVRTQVSDLDYDTPPALNATVTMDRAWHIMREQRISAIPVVNEDGTLYGTLSAGDIATYSMNTISEPRVEALPLFNLLSVIEGRVLNDTGDLVDSVTGDVVIALPQSCENLLWNGKDHIVLCGDQPDMIRRALETNVCCLILCQTEVDQELLADARNTCIISSPYDASRVARLIYQAIPISRPCHTDDIVCFHLSDYIDDVREVVLKSRYRCYPVLDQNEKVVGTLSRYHLLRPRRKRVVLVDHNERAQAVQGLDQAEILEIIDHHRLADIQTTQPIRVRNEPVGSTNTIITEMYQEHGVMPSPAMAGLMAAELGADVQLAKRAGLLHDIGKVPDDEPELPHAIIGMKLAEKFKEKPEVCNAIGAHHDEVEMTSLIAPIIQVCDAISGARPGARREVVESYIKRLKEMEDIALSYPGVMKTYAIQAGRELRVIVGADKLSDQESEGLSHDIAKKIQDEMTYPGQVKITVIRETRAVSYAK
mgnify:CR=1 FL=1